MTGQALPGIQKPEDIRSTLLALAGVADDNAVLYNQLSRLGLAGVSLLKRPRRMVPSKAPPSSAMADSRYRRMAYMLPYFGSKVFGVAAETVTGEVYKHIFKLSGCGKCRLEWSKAFRIGEGVDGDELTNQELQNNARDGANKVHNDVLGCGYMFSVTASAMHRTSRHSNALAAWLESVGTKLSPGKKKSGLRAPTTTAPRGNPAAVAEASPSSSGHSHDQECGCSLVCMDDTDESCVDLGSIFAPPSAMSMFSEGAAPASL